MRIAVMGTGGLGGYYGGLLARREHQVTFIARGAHLQAILKNGLQVNSFFGDFLIRPAQATDKPADIGPVDLVLFCTKTYDTEKAAASAKPLIGTQTAVLSLQNGIDAADRIGQILGSEHVLAGATWISSALAGPGVIKQVSHFHRVVVGEPKGTVTARLQAVHEAFKQAGATAELSETIQSVLWAKFVFLAAASGFGSLTRLPVGGYRAVPETRALVAELMRETAALAAAEHVHLDPDVVEQSLAFMDNNRPEIKPSMQLDVESGHPSELESIIGVIGRKGRELRVPTPVADMIYALLLPTDLKSRV